MTQMDKITTTLAQIRAHRPCENRYKKLCKSLGGVKAYGKDTPLTFRRIYESNDYEGTLWCLRTVGKRWEPLWQHFAVDCAEDVKHLMVDKRSLRALEVSRRYADGLATDEELDAARVAACAAVLDVDNILARSAARTATYTAGSAAAKRAGSAARNALSTAANIASATVSVDIVTARSNPWSVAWEDGRAAAEAVQMERLFKCCKYGKRP